MAAEWLDHRYFSEMCPAGNITPQEWKGVLSLPESIERRLLIDYSNVKRIDVSMGHLISAAEALASARVKVALIAPKDSVFATLRKVAILARVQEGQDLALFRGRAPAVQWLLAGLVVD